MGQIEWNAEVFQSEADGFRFPQIFGKMREIARGYLDCQGGSNDLRRFFAVNFEASAEDFVALDDLLQSTLKHIGAKIATHADGSRYVVGEAFGIKLLDQPEALLCE